MFGSRQFWDGVMLRCAVLSAFSQGPKLAEMVPETLLWRILPVGPLDLSGLWDDI